tara:strand:+ start:2506 stop:2799 length:294 start_codon:yes stop_codon:yes gene_type:complete
MKKRWFQWWCFFWGYCSAVILLSACSRINQDNYNRIHAGMLKSKVIALLGAPDSTSGLHLGSTTAEDCHWCFADANIDIIFVNQRVSVKTNSDVVLS